MSWIKGLFLLELLEENEGCAIAVDYQVATPNHLLPRRGQALTLKEGESMSRSFHNSGIRA